MRHSVSAFQRAFPHTVNWPTLPLLLQSTITPWIYEVESNSSEHSLRAFPL